MAKIQEATSIHNFWDTPQHFLKTHVLAKESAFLSFPELQELLLVSIGKDLEALAFTISEIPHSIFSKHIFA